IINMEAIEETFIEIIKRHEVLRSTFVVASSNNSAIMEGEPRLLIRKSIPFKFSLIHLGKLSSSSSDVVVDDDDDGDNNDNDNYEEDDSPPQTITRRTITTSSS